MGVRHAFAVLLALLTGTAAFASRENLLKNPGAEQGEVGWRPFYLHRGKARVLIADGVARAGEKASLSATPPRNRGALPGLYGLYWAGSVCG